MPVLQHSQSISHPLWLVRPSWSSARDAPITF